MIDHHRTKKLSDTVVPFRQKLYSCRAVYRLCVSIVRNKIYRDRRQNRYGKQRYVGNGYDTDNERVQRMALGKYEQKDSRGEVFLRTGGKISRVESPVRLRQKRR